MLSFGFDFGSTTSSAMLIEARVVMNCVTGRREFGDVQRHYCSQPALTPFVERRLDERLLAAMIDRWLAESGAAPDQIHAGGAIVTGLAARAENAATIAEIIKSRCGDSLIATADDPCLESWLAFMGNTLALSRAHPSVPFVNLDIGGGTTNAAWGRDGQVHGVGCLFLGARHVRFAAGTYEVVQLSKFAERIWQSLRITSQVGERLRSGDCDRLLDFHVTALESLLTGDRSHCDSHLLNCLEQVRFYPPLREAIVTFSGGVGELVYRHAAGEPLPATTYFGDLGIDLAERIVASPRLSRHLRSHAPPHAGRATVAGLTIYNTELSGNTYYLPRPAALPWRDLPILGRLCWSDEPGIAHDFGRRLPPLLELAARHSGGACLAIEVGRDDHQSIKRLGEGIAEALLAAKFPSQHPLVLLVSANVGKTLGQYATHWGALGMDLVVLDEVCDRRASFVTLGKVIEQSVPLSFYGMLSDPSDERE
jgi:ethanolamine utilization protein EutA